MELLPIDSQPQPLTVTDLTTEIRRRLESGFGKVWVRGEISNWRPAASGHAYFSLKDSQSVIACALFGVGRRAVAQFLKEGVAVLVRGRLTVYGPRGSYQLIVDEIEPLGDGALTQAFQALKTKLEAMGLFAATRKKTIPLYPRHIGILTSAQGAALQDMLKILERRAPHVRITVIPSVVQGAGAAAELIAGIGRAEKIRDLDVLVLARGGGSFEDLFCFSDEALAHRVAACRLPTISAVGHEIDFSISDFVCDLRAPTPSAAAEILSNGWVDALTRLGELEATLGRQMRRMCQVMGLRIREMAARLVSPKDRVREQIQRLDDIEAQLRRAVLVSLERTGARVERLSAALAALSPLGVLDRGYALVRDSEGRVVRAAGELKTSQQLELTLKDGVRHVVVQ